MAAETACLRPVSGSPRDVETLVRSWLDETSPPALTVRTSGSGGPPKDVLLSAAAMRASATATLSRLGGAGSWVLALPTHYVAGLQVVVRSVLAATSPVVLDDHPDLAAATAALPKQRRYVAAVPTQLHRWLRRPRDVAALRTYEAVLVGGAAASPDLQRRARALGVRLVTTYGMTETCGGCVYDGVALDGVALALDADGIIRVAGPVLFDGYAGRRDSRRDLLPGGWFATSDRGRLDADGRLEVLGRVDDVAVSGGVNVPLGAVEQRLADMPELAEAAVVSVPDEEWGARVVAVVVPAGQSPGLEAVRDFVSRKHPREWAPRQLVVLDELPLLESGKVDRRAVLRRLGGSGG